MLQQEQVLTLIKTIEEKKKTRSITISRTLMIRII
jgi:hypothetical protein